MAASCPVIASDVASLPEVVGRDGAGILVDPASVDQLAAALVELAEDPDRRRAMGERAHERARKRFPLEAMVSSTLDAYEEIR
jgi:glycosyltransferase involved in cell wall biosynthesis